jgi:hypothetical protein
MNIENNDILDDEWIKTFDNTDKFYKDFYKEDLYYINIKIIYINRENEIDKIKKESFLMSKSNTISQDEIFGILKRNAIDNEKRYSLLSILKYNIDIEPDEVENYLNHGYNNYLSNIRNIDTITFDNSINMFHDLNDLILIFHEKNSKKTHLEEKNITKKIYLMSNIKRKTIRKPYKD